ncbi:MAG TPA: preprotein translocase subunit SecG [Chthonomonadales bacterium]|nr:preprotein translocase subunit SecG [Chthonomonadales bacterium]
MHIVLSVFQVAVALLLIGIIAIQQSKSEGLGGTIGGKVSSAFKGKPGFDDKLTDWTKMLGGAFIVVSILVAVTAGR